MTNNDNKYSLATDLLEAALTNSEERAKTVLRKFLDVALLSRAFKKIGKYRQAKRASAWLLANIAELEQSAAPDLMVAVEALRAEAMESQKLPDIDARVQGDSEPGLRQIPGPERFPVGTTVRIADEDKLKTYTRPSWKYHHPVQPQQLPFSGRLSTVKRVEYYHGGDLLYYLTDTGEYAWHEDCLTSAGDTEVTA